MAQKVASRDLRKFYALTTDNVRHVRHFNGRVDYEKEVLVAL